MIVPTEVGVLLFTDYQLIGWKDTDGNKWIELNVITSQSGDRYLWRISN